MGVVLAMVCFLIVVILATTDEAEVLPPVEEDENAKKPVDDAAQMYKKVDKKETYREGFGEFWDSVAQTMLSKTTYDILFVSFFAAYIYDNYYCLIFHVVEECWNR